MIRQSLLLIVLSVLIVVGLLIWGIPALVEYAGFLGEVKSSTQNVGQQDTLAPYPPQLNIAAEATSSANLDIVGYAEADASITLFDNGQEVTSVVANEDGEFTFKAVELNQGENKFAALATDAAGNDSDRSPEKSVWFDNSPPDLSLVDLTDGKQLVALPNDTLSIQGETEPGAVVYVNGRLTQSDSEGVFDQQVRLNDGENTLTFKAVDKAGNTNEMEIKVNYDR